MIKINRLRALAMIMGLINLKKGVEKLMLRWVEPLKLKVLIALFQGENGRARKIDIHQESWLWVERNVGE
jgi:hypothetical protein